MRNHNEVRSQCAMFIPSWVTVHLAPCSGRGESVLMSVSERAKFLKSVTSRKVCEIVVLGNTMSISNVAAAEAPP